MSFKPIEQQGEYHQGTRNSISSEQAHNHVMEDLPRSKSHKSRVEEVSERIEGYQEKRKERSVEYGCQKEINSRQYTAVVDEESRQEINDAFKVADMDCDGELNEIELGEALRSLGINLSRKQQEEWMNRSESNLSSGKIVQTEFTNLVLRKLQQSLFGAEALKEVYEYFSPNEQNYLHLKQLKEAKQYTGLTDEEVQEVFKALDSTGNGYINYQEFRDFVNLP